MSDSIRAQREQREHSLSSLRTTRAIWRQQLQDAIASGDIIGVHSAMFAIKRIDEAIEAAGEAESCTH